MAAGGHADRRPTAAQLIAESKQRRRAKRDCFQIILEKVYHRINAKAKLNWVRILYDVPPFTVGIPPYDVDECCRYICRALRKDGYFVEVHASILYISWAPEELS